MASDLFRLVNKVQEKAKEVTDGVGDGLQRVANKTEDLTKRVNRTVNPFSSHFGSGSNQSSPAAGGLLRVWYALRGTEIASGASRVERTLSLQQRGRDHAQPLGLRPRSGAGQTELKGRGQQQSGDNLCGVSQGRSAPGDTIVGAGEGGAPGCP
eukprot:157745-Rhodomonas_salina.1